MTALTVFALSGLVNGLSTTFLGLFVFLQARRDERHQTYLLTCFILSVWSYAYFFWLMSTDPSDAQLWARIFMSAAVFIPPSAYHHLLKLLDKKVPRKFVLTNYLLSLFLFLANFDTWLVKNVSSKSIFPFWPDPGPLFHVHFAQIVALSFLGLWTLSKEHRTSGGLRRNQIKFLLIAEGIGWPGAFTNYPLWYDIPILPYGNILVTFYAAIFAYAVVRYRLLDIEVVLKKSLTYALLLLVLLVPCYLVVIWGQQTAFGHIDYLFSILTLMVFIIVGFLFPKLRFRTEEALERVLFKKRVNYRNTLLNSSRDMVSIVDLEDLSNNLVRTISKALGVKRASLFLVDDVKGAYNLVAVLGNDVSSFKNTCLLRSDPLVTEVSKSREGIVKEELEMTREIPNSQQTAEKMGQIDAEISLPIISKHKLIGILNLGAKEEKGVYSNEDLELLSTLANQAAVAIENARLYQNLKQSQDTLRRADRLSSLGLLTAGLAHEIRNPLVAIRTFTQLLPERYEDAEFRDGFQSLALKEVDRICGLITDLLSFARPSRPNVAQEDMNDVIDGIARILDTQAKEKSVELTRDFAPNLPKVWIDREQMKQVFMNLIFNGIQAMNDGGTITISTRISTPAATDQSPSFVQVEVRDTGIGIPEENLEHIFDPFFTNKDEGSGLGLSISHQIVQEHGGYVTVQSKVGKGTSFLVNIPTGKPGRPVAERNLQVNEANLSH